MPSKSVCTLFALLAAAASVVVAQQPSGTQTGPSGSLPSLSPCVLKCIQDEAVDDRECSSGTDFQCICTNQHVQSEIAECLAEHCTPQDQQAALEAQKQQCAAFTGGASGTTPTATGTGTPRPTGSATTPTTNGGGAAGTATATGAGSAQTTNAAVGRIVGGSGLRFVALAAGIVGVAF